MSQKRYIKEHLYLEDVSLYTENDTIPSLIRMLQEKHDYYTEKYPNHEITYDIEYEGSNLEIIGRSFYENEEEWKEAENAKKAAREQADLDRERALYEKLHAKFNKS